MPREGCEEQAEFEEAESVFFDEQAREYFDPDHSEEEDRFLLVGRSYKLRILLICHCYREGDRDPLRDCLASKRRPTLNWAS